MSLELIFFLLAGLALLGSVAAGWFFGGAGIIRYLLATLFATLVALRYWHGCAQALAGSVSINPLFVAGGVFAALFLVGLALAGAVARFKAARFASVQADPLDKTLGVVFGLALGLLVGGSLLLDLSFFGAGAKGDFDPAHFPARLDQAPVALFRWVETDVASVPPGSATLLPVVKPMPAGESKGSLTWD